MHKMQSDVGQRGTGSGWILARTLPDLPQRGVDAYLPEAAVPGRQLRLFRKIYRILRPACVQVSPDLPWRITVSRTICPSPLDRKIPSGMFAFLSLVQGSQVSPLLSPPLYFPRSSTNCRSRSFRYSWKRKALAKTTTNLMAFSIP